MSIGSIKNKINFILKQNLKKQTFKKEYRINFDNEVENFINTYSKRIPNELNLNHYTDLLGNIDFKDRIKNLQIVKNAINFEKKVNFKKNHNIKNNIEELEKNGITNIKFLDFSKEKIKSFLNKVDKLKRYKGHTIHHAEGDPVEKSEMRENNFYCFESRKILEFTEIQDLLNNENLKNFVYEYFGCLPTLNSLNVYVTTKSNEEKSVQMFHRDNEDFKNLNIFFLLQDTKKNNGGHAFIKGSHNPNSLKKIINKEEFNQIKIVAKKEYDLELNSIDDLCNLPKDGYGYEKIYKFIKKNEVDVHGDAGKIFAEDNFGLHKSIKNTNNRIIFWLSFSLTSQGVLRYCITHKILRKFIPKRIYYSKIKNNMDSSFFNKYVYRHYINFLK